MNTGPLYSVTALYDSPDALLHASEETVKNGYTKFDCHTPYPVHGLDTAMSLKGSTLGYVAFAFGALGALSAIGFITWVTSVDYPLVIGGKPFWSWPAFVPPVFEVTVLLASVLTTLVMIAVYFKLPNNAHPLHDTPYMKGVSADKFGLAIQADDPKFDEKKVTAFLKGTGSKKVEAVYYDADEAHHGVPLFEGRFIALLSVVALVTVALAYGTLNYALYWEPFNWMQNQHKLKAQKANEFFKDGIGMRPPVEGTVARGFIPYAFKGKPDDAAKFMVNPLLPTKEIIQRGHERFLTFCSPCHGNFGRGDSRLNGQFPNPPTLHSDKVRTWPDASIYHVITEGQNIMPSYAAQIARDDRWAIIHYLRVMQRAQNAKESDLK